MPTIQVLMISNLFTHVSTAPREILLPIMERVISTLTVSEAGVIWGGAMISVTGLFSIHTRSSALLLHSRIGGRYGWKIIRMM